MIYLSETAVGEIKRLQSSRQKINSCLRLGVKTGGCFSLSYTLKLEETKSERLPQSNSSEEHLYESNGISVIVDKQSYTYLNGLKLDYSEDLMGGGFRFHNPNATATCSCGQSFSIES